MRCQNCGQEIPDNVSYCPHCGAAPEQDPYAASPIYQPQQPQQQPVVDKGGFLWGLLGCCIPIVGLILFLVWKDTKPRTARAAGIGALVCVGVMVVYYIAMIALGIGVAVFS